MLRSLKWFLPERKGSDYQMPYLQESGIRQYPEPLEPTSHIHTLFLEEVVVFCVAFSDQHFICSLLQLP
jgi:hypothetical protein